MIKRKENPIKGNFLHFFFFLNFISYMLRHAGESVLNKTIPSRSVRSADGRKRHLSWANRLAARYGGIRSMPNNIMRRQEITAVALIGGARQAAQTITERKTNVTRVTCRLQPFTGTRIIHRYDYSSRANGHGSGSPYRLQLFRCRLRFHVESRRGERKSDANSRARQLPHNRSQP